MSDREEILELVATYAHAVDERDLDRILSVFAPGGRIDFEGGAMSGVGHAGIRSAFETAFAAPMLAPPSASTHLMANTLVTVDGDRARAETQAVAFLSSAATATVVTRGLRYSDDLERVDGEWRITHRVHRSLWQTEAPGTIH